MNCPSQTITAFLDAVASENVTPAGGTAAAVTGATGAALCEMVCIHTIEKEGDGDVDPELRPARDELNAQREHLLRLADADAGVVDDLSGSGPPSQAVLKRATGVPLTIAEACATVLDAAVVPAAVGTERARPDAVTGAYLVQSGLQSAVFTVRTNTDYIDDRAFTDQMATRISTIAQSGSDAFDQICSIMDVQ